MPGMSRLVSDIVDVTRVAGLGAGLTFTASVVRKTSEVLRSGTLVAVDQLMDQKAWTFRPLPGATVRLPKGTFGIAREMYCRRVYFRRPGFTLQPGDTVLDLGANQGLFSVLAAVAGARQVIAVEAQDGFSPIMTAHLHRNGVGHQVKLYHTLLGPGSGVLAEAEARRSASHWGSEPDVRTLDDLVEENALAQIDFAKVDIEGSEFAVFREDTHCLDIMRTIVMEVHTAYGDPAALAALLERRGFSVTLTDNSLHEVSAIRDESGYLYAQRA